MTHSVYKSIVLGDSHFEACRVRIWKYFCYGEKLTLANLMCMKPMIMVPLPYSYTPADRKQRYPGALFLRNRIRLLGLEFIRLDRPRSAIAARFLTSTNCIFAFVDKLRGKQE